MVANKRPAQNAFVKITIDTTQPFQDTILDPAGLAKFLIDRIKVDNKTGNFESIDKKTGKVEKAVVVSVNGGKVTVDAILPFKKRYLKYLTKKYMKKQQIRDFLRVISTGPTTYTLKYFSQRSNQAAAE